jgi:uncharacterized protein YggE
MNKFLILLSLLLSLREFSVSAQGSAGSVYGGSHRRTSGVATGSLMHVDPTNSVASSFIEANVLMNVRADEYRAVFGLAQDGPTPAEASKKIEAQIKEFLAALEGLGVKQNDVFVDFIIQNRVYDYSVKDGNVAEENPAGFEVKKNVAIRYKDRSLFERMIAAAAKSSIFDLIKDDYVVSDMPAARRKLLEEASAIIKRKEANYAHLFDLKMHPMGIYEERYNAFFPAEMYSSYVAYESGNVETSNLRYVSRRKTSTFYLDSLHPAEFDAMINPSGVEPVVQLTLFLKMKYAPVK